MNKKLFLSFSMVLALVAMVLTSCSKEQTYMDIEDIPGKATIMGNLSYDAGQGYANGKYTQLIKPVVNVRVLAKVSNQSLSPNKKAQGYTYYEVFTDENGNYSIEVPAVDEGTAVKVEVGSFLGTYSTVKSVANGNPVFDNKEVQYTINEKDLSVTPYQVAIYDASYTDNGRNKLKADEYNSIFTIKVGEGVYVKSVDENDKEVVEKEYKLVSGKNVIAAIDGIYYGATTDSKGEAKFTIPSKSKKWSTTANIEIEGYVNNNFTYYDRVYDYDEGAYKYEKQTIKGIYQQQDNSVSLSFTGISGVQTVAKVRMIFKPFEGEETYGYSLSDWNNYSWDN